MADRTRALGVGLIGCGQIAQERHLPALQSLPDADIIAVADSDAARLNRAADSYHVQQRHRDYRALLDLPTIDAVAVCVPPQLHAEIALAVLDAGKHLFIEKPLALSLSEADDIIARAAQVGTKAMVGFNMRWHRLVRATRDIVQRGGLGSPTLVRTVFTVGDEYRAAPPAWRLQDTLGGGLLFEHAAHHFDLWRFLVRSDVEEVFAQHGGESAAAGHATVAAQLANGVLVTSAFAHGCSENAAEIFGSAGWLRLSCYRFDGLECSAASDSPSAIRARLRGVARVLQELPHAVRQMRHGGDYVASYCAEWRHFIEAIRNDTPVECTLADGRHALQVALAAVHSAASGQPVHVAHAPATLPPLSSRSGGNPVRN